MEDKNRPTTARKKNSLAATLRNFNRFRLCVWLVLVVAVCIGLFLFFRLSKNNTIGFFVNDSINITPKQVMEISEIGEWEFLSVEDEEMVDTLRKGIFYDDYLVRIYYGTLRLGFDLGEAKENWITMDKGTLNVVLPAIRLLDERFIDEARTKSFFESGSWSDRDRDDLYQRAYRKMIHRCLTVENIQCAKENAGREFRRMLTDLGYDDVQIRFEEATENPYSPD